MTTPFGYYAGQEGLTGPRGPAGPNGADGNGIASINIIDNLDGTTSVSYTMDDTTILGPFNSSLLSDNLIATSVETSGFIKTPNLKTGGTTYSLPEDGTTGQILKTDGAGNLDWIANQQDVIAVNASSGLISGGVLSIGTPNTTFSISDGKGYIIDDLQDPPTITPITWTGKTNIPVTNIATQLITFVSLDLIGDVIQQSSRWSPQKSRTCILLGVIVHTDLATVTDVNQEQVNILAPISQLRDLYETLGFINSGNILSANGANLSIDKSSGVISGFGLNYSNNSQDPNNLILPAKPLATFQLRLSDGTNITEGTILDTVNYESAPGVYSALSNNKYQVFRFYSFVSNNLKCQPGQKTYATAQEAISDIPNTSFITEPSFSSNGMLIAYVVVQKSETNLQNATFVSSGKFQGSVLETGGGVLPTLQSAYDNSALGEIIIDSVKPFEIQSASSNTQMLVLKSDTDEISLDARQITLSVQGPLNSSKFRVLKGTDTGDPVLSVSTLNDTVSAIKLETNTLISQGSTYTLPADGSTNQVLTTNGSGTLSWSSKTSVPTVSLQATYDASASPKTMDISAGDLILSSGIVYVPQLNPETDNNGSNCILIKTSDSLKSKFINHISEVSSTNSGSIYSHQNHHTFVSMHGDEFKIMYSDEVSDTPTIFSATDLIKIDAPTKSTSLFGRLLMTGQDIGTSGLKLNNIYASGIFIDDITITNDLLPIDATSNIGSTTKIFNSIHTSSIVNTSDITISNNLVPSSTYSLGLVGTPWTNTYSTNINSTTITNTGTINSGHILPISNNTYDLGSVASRYGNVFATTGEFYKISHPDASVPGNHAIQINGTTDYDLWLNYRSGGGLPRGRCGCIFSHLSTTHYFLHNNDGILNIAYSAEDDDEPDIDNATTILQLTTAGLLKVDDLQVDTLTGKTASTVSPSCNFNPLTKDAHTLGTSGTAWLSGYATSFYTTNTYADHVRSKTSTQIKFYDHIVPDADASINLGSDGLLAFNRVYAFGTLTSSDRRLKNTITPLDVGKTELMALKPVKYLWNREPKQTKFTYGLIAQDVQELLTDSCMVSGKDRLSLDYNQIIPLLVKTVQDQQKIIDIQNTDLIYLKHSMAKLTRMVEELNDRM